MRPVKAGQDRRQHGYLADSMQMQCCAIYSEQPRRTLLPFTPGRLFAVEDRRTREASIGLLPRAQGRTDKRSSTQLPRLRTAAARAQAVACARRSRAIENAREHLVEDHLPGASSSP